MKWTLLSERVGGEELVVALPEDGGMLDVSRLVRGWRGFFLQASSAQMSIQRATNEKYDQI